MPLETLVGQQLMVGISSARLTPEITCHLKTIHAGGFIVFRRNFSSALHFRKLITDIERNLGWRLLISVDHEGGRVIHLREGITVFPDNWMIGNTGKAAFAEKQGALEARELRRLGIDLNLAPTLDVLTEKFSPNIGIRSYGKSAEMVAQFGTARIAAMQAGGLSACAKHFPGQGQSPLDAHLSLPVLPTTWEELEQIHLKPFQAAIAAGVDTIMSSHPVYPSLDDSKVPATFSTKIIKGLLREKLNFQGLILSDDLEMGSLRNLCPLGEAAVRAVAAGHDMILVCESISAQQEVYQALLKAYQNGRLSIEDLKQSVERIEKLKAKRPMRFSAGEIKPEKEGAEIARSIAQKGIKVPKGKLPWTPQDKIAVIFPRLSTLSERIHIETEMEDEAAFLRQAFKQAGINFSKLLLVELDPNKAEVEKVLQSFSPDHKLIFFCYDAHLSSGNRAILNHVQRLKDALVIFLRDPYDESLLLSSLPFITTYGFRAVQITEAILRIPPLIKSRPKSKILQRA